MYGPAPPRGPNIQDSFLFQSLMEGRRVNVLLLTGKALNGTRIKRFDPSLLASVGES